MMIFADVGTPLFKDLVAFGTLKFVDGHTFLPFQKSLLPLSASVLPLAAQCVQGSGQFLKLSRRRIRNDTRDNGLSSCLRRRLQQALLRMLHALS